MGCIGFATVYHDLCEREHEIMIDHYFLGDCELIYIYIYIYCIYTKLYIGFT